MATCQNVKRKLVRHGRVNLATGDTSTEHSEWVTEPCNIPVFDGETTCLSCRTGWRRPENYPVDEKPPIEETEGPPIETKPPMSETKRTTTET